MRPTRGVILFVEASGEWTLSVRTGGGPIETEKIAAAGTDPAAAARSLAERLARSAGRCRLLLALAPECCLCATVDRDPTQHRRDSKSLLFALEESLPMAAEDVRAVVIRHEKQLFGVVAIRALIDPVLSAIENEKIDVVAVCPAAMLALQGAALAPSEAGGDDVVLLQEGTTTHLFGFAGTKLDAWLSVPSDPRDVAFAIASRMFARQSVLRATLINLDVEAAKHVGAISGLAVSRRLDRPLREMQHSAADMILRGRWAPDVDFTERTGSIFSGPIPFSVLAAMAACVLLCACLCASLLWRGNRYSHLAAGAQADEELVFRRVFPGQSIPPGIRSRLQSAAGRPKPDDVPAATDAGPDALAVLHEVLVHLPRDVRYDITQIDAEPGQIALQGQVRSHEDADAIAMGLRRSPRIEIDDPQTQQIGPAAVQFSISGPVFEANPPGEAPR